ncbi:MAG: hypothetical protein Q9174_003828, partial [Haloplaca sp. 1 TL-2023]
FVAVDRVHESLATKGSSGIKKRKDQNRVSSHPFPTPETKKPPLHVKLPLTHDPFSNKARDEGADNHKKTSKVENQQYENNGPKTGEVQHGVSKLDPGPQSSLFRFRQISPSCEGQASRTVSILHRGRPVRHGARNDFLTRGQEEAADTHTPMLRIDVGQGTSQGEEDF